jgi:hypothetical protein
MCAALALYAGEFSDRFNPSYPIHGFDSPITTRDLIETGNFISVSVGSRAVVPFMRSALDATKNRGV